MRDESRAKKPKPLTYKERKEKRKTRKLGRLEKQRSG